MFKLFLGEDDDWIEPTRLYLYPRLHNKLVGVGDLIGVPLYATGSVGWNQYVGTLEEDEEAIEKELEDLAGVRNPIACLKELPDGRVSEGSWVLLHDDAPELVSEGMQLHITLFKRDSDKVGREVYAHYEDDWRVSPLVHLKGNNFDVQTGVEKATQFFDRSTFLVLAD